MKLKDTPWKKSYDQPRQYIKNQRHYFANKGLSGQSCGFSSHHIWMWELDCKESWPWKNWCFWTVVLEKTLESPLDCKEIQPVNSKGNQSWIFIGTTDAEVELQYFGHLMQRTDPLEKTLILGKIEDGRRRGWQRMRWLDGMTDVVDMMSTIRGHHHGHIWVGSRSWWWMGKPGVLQSTGSQRVGQDWATELNWIYISLGFPGGATGKEDTCQCRRQKRPRFYPWVGKIPWRRKWQSTPVFLPGESHGQRSLVSYSPWGCKGVRHDWATKQQQQPLYISSTHLIIQMLLLYCDLFL